MEALCSSDLPYWNITQIWYSDQPDLPLCFQETSLVWTPCLFLLLVLPYHVIRALQRKRNLISRKLAEKLQNGSIDDPDVLHLSRQNSTNPTPRNSISSTISNNSTKILKSIAEKAIENNSKKNKYCINAFPFRQFQSSLLTGIKQTVTLCLIVLSFVELFYGLFTDFSTQNLIEKNNNGTNFKNTFPEKPPIFESVTPAIKIAIFLIALSIQYIHWRHRIISSISLFIFWAIFTVQAALSTRSLLWNYFEWFDNIPESKYSHYQDSVYVGCKLAGNALIFIELILSLMPEPKLKTENDDEEDDSDTFVLEEIDEANSVFRKFPDLRSLPKCPLNHASVLSRLTFWWVSPIIWNTFCRPPLTFSQIWALQPINWSIVNSSKFSRFFVVKRRETKSRHNAKKRVYFTTTGLMWSLVCTFWPQIAFNAFLKLCTTFLPYLSALFLSWLINFMEAKEETGAIQEPVWHGAVYVALMLITPLLDTLLHVQYNFGVNIVLLRIKASLCNAIYRKGLRLSSAGREQFTTGEVINLMAIDTQRVGDFFLFLNDTWSVPLQILFAVYLLWDQLGVASLAGLVLMVLIMPLNAYLVSHLRGLSQYVMEYKDKRLKLMHDILSGIKVLKLYAWENSFFEQVQQRREHELAKLRSRLYYQAAVVFIFNSAPFFVTVSSFATYIFLDRGHRLDPEKAFVSLALFNQLRNPFAMLPRVIAFYAMFIVSLRRLNRYFRGEELYQPNDGSLVKLRRDSTAIYDVKVENGAFTWSSTTLNGPLKSILKKKFSYYHPQYQQQQQQQQSPAAVQQQLSVESRDTENGGEAVNSSSTKGGSKSKSKPILEEINMQARKGQLVAIVGQVGSGKSSLISALLGDMHKLGGVVKINRSIAYVAQQAWIQNATVRENILFLNRYDEEKYRAVVDACALAPDLAILPAGDQTEIGEKGITLSGGQKQRIAIARAAYTAASLYLLDDPLSALDAHVSRHIFDRVIGPKGMLRTATRILVTHRMAVLSQCDYIYVMKKGRVVESGTFAQLLAARGGEGGGGGGSFSELLTNYLVAHEEHTGASSSSEEEEEGVFGEANPRHSFTGSFEGDESDQENLETVRRKVLAEDDIDETELFINSVFKEIDELSVGGGEEGEVHLPGHHQLKPKANRVVSFLELSQPPSGQSSLASSVPSSVSSRASARSTSSTKAIYPKELANTTQIQPEGRVTLHQNTTVEQSTGSSSVTMSAYGKYFKRLGLLACAFILLSQCAQLLCNIAAAQWLSRWSEEQLVNSGHKPEVPADDNYSTNLRNLAVYTVLGLGECFFTLFTTLVISFSTLKAAKLLHADMLSRILRAPMSFFDTNPIGRILNRFSRDIDICDTILNMNLRIALFTAFRTVAAILIIAIDTPPVLGAVLPLAIFYFVIQRMFLPTSRQLRRIESTTRSPIYSHFDESLSGSSTIRAFGKQSAFIIESNRRIDQNHVASWAINGCTQWIITRLEFLGYMVVFANALYCLINRENIQASITGLTLTYSMTITRNLNHFIMVTSELENSVVSFERCLEYCKMTTEADYYKDEQDPPEAQPKSTDQTSTSLAEVWPSQGAIEFRDFSTRYRPNLNLVLKSINFIVLPGERVGVVGRTGAGKSSLTLALFRILERASGKIIVDGRDIADLGLHSIRSRMTIIPQDPVLFTGTLRLNIDPFGKHSDEELWSALELVNLRPFVQSFEAGLNHTITEGGDNLSVGQRQLLSLARALLRKSRILVLDEATAAVDMETDAIIQQTIRQHFFGSTILTIAHRIETIFDYDRILLMHNGEVLEYDSPERLIATPHSLFRSLAREAGLV